MGVGSLLENPNKPYFGEVRVYKLIKQSIKKLRWLLTANSKCTSFITLEKTEAIFAITTISELAHVISTFSLVARPISTFATIARPISTFSVVARPISTFSELAHGISTFSELAR